MTDPIIDLVKNPLTGGHHLKEDPMKKYISLGLAALAAVLVVWGLIWFFKPSGPPPKTPAAEFKETLKEKGIPPSPEERLSAVEKAQAEILDLLRQGPPKAPPAAVPQAKTPSAGQAEGYGQQGDPRMQQQPQGGYAQQQGGGSMPPTGQAGGYGSQQGPRHDNVGMNLRVVSGGNGRPFSASHLHPDAEQACPSGKVKLEPAKRDAGGVKMTREQIARGDKRWHVVCVD